MPKPPRGQRGDGRMVQTASSPNPENALEKAGKFALDMCIGDNSLRGVGEIDARLAEASVAELRALSAGSAGQQGAFRQGHPTRSLTIPAAPSLLALYALALRWSVADRVAALNSSQDTPSHGSTDPAPRIQPPPEVPSTPARPPAAACSLLRRSLAAFLAERCMAGLAQQQRQLQPAAAAAVPRVQPASAVAAAATATSAATAAALLRGGTLQCYAHLLLAAHRRLLPTQLRRPSDAPVRDALELLHEVSQLLIALADAAAAEGRGMEGENAPRWFSSAPRNAAAEAATGDAKPVCGPAEPDASPPPPLPAAAPSPPPPAPTPPRPPTGTIPSSSSPSLRDLLSAQLVDSGLLEHLARLTLELLVQLASKETDDEIDRPIGQWTERQQADVLRAVTAALAAGTHGSCGSGGEPCSPCSSSDSSCVSSGPAQVPGGPQLPLPQQQPRGLVSGPGVQFLLLVHTMALCDAAERWRPPSGGGGEGPPAAAPSAAAGDITFRDAWGLMARRLRLWDEERRPVPQLWGDERPRLNVEEEVEGPSALPSCRGAARSPREQQRRQPSSRPPPPPPPPLPSPPPEPHQHLCTDLVVQFLNAMRAELAARDAAATPPPLIARAPALGASPASDAVPAGSTEGVLMPGGVGEAIKDSPDADSVAAAIIAVTAAAAAPAAATAGWSSWRSGAVARTAANEREGWGRWRAKPRR